MQKIASVSTQIVEKSEFENKRKLNAQKRKILRFIVPMMEVCEKQFPKYNAELNTLKKIQQYVLKYKFLPESYSSYLDKLAINLIDNILDGDQEGSKDD